MRNNKCFIKRKEYLKDLLNIRFQVHINKEMIYADTTCHEFLGKGTKFNETVNVACANEFVVNGTNSTDIQLRCTENGTWEEFPGCVVSHCKPSDLIAIQGTILANHSLQAK